jgi:hypothetical protein
MTGRAEAGEKPRLVKNHEGGAGVLGLVYHGPIFDCWLVLPCLRILPRLEPVQVSSSLVHCEGLNYPIKPQSIQIHYHFVSTMLG